MHPQTLLLIISVFCRISHFRAAWMYENKKCGWNETYSYNPVSCITKRNYNDNYWKNLWSLIKPMLQSKDLPAYFEWLKDSTVESWLCFCQERTTSDFEVTKNNGKVSQDGWSQPALNGSLFLSHSISSSALGSSHPFLVNHLETRRICARWVPRNVTFEQRVREYLYQDGSKWKCRSHHFEPETNLESSASKEITLTT